MPPVDDTHSNSARENFSKQRRNLLFLASLLILLEVAGIGQIKNDQSLFGFGFVIEWPEVIPYFLWTLFFYFMFRFSQTWYELSTSTPGQQAFPFFENEAKKVVLKMARQIKEIMERLEDELGEVSLSLFDFSIIKDYRDQVTIQSTFRVSYSRDDKNPNSVGSTDPYDFVIDGWQLRWIRALAVIKNSIYTGFFIEYYLPAYLALGLTFTKVYLIYSN
jgi:hypothetical protein